jgi:hypothetical protein
MASKKLIIASLLGASVGVPYVASKATNGNASPSATPPLASATSAPAPPLIGVAGVSPAGKSTAATATSPAIIAPKSPSAEQALNFNVTKDWVYRSWDRKSTGPTDLGLFAVRVPLVSGTQKASLAGSLTYYFNTQDQVEHLSFRGRTGDPSRLVRFLMQNYQLQPISSQPGEQIYQLGDSGGIISELRTRPEPIVANSHGAHSVELELARPGSQRYLPPRGPILNVPQTPDATAAAQIKSSNAAAPSGDASNSSASSFSGYLEGVRYATPVEEEQANWKRWPN